MENHLVLVQYNTCPSGNITVSFRQQEDIYVSFTLHSSEFFCCLQWEYVIIAKLKCNELDTFPTDDFSLNVPILWWFSFRSKDVLAAWKTDPKANSKRHSVSVANSPVTNELYTVLTPWVTWQMWLCFKMLQKDYGKDKILRPHARMHMCVYVCMHIFIQNLATIQKNILWHGTTEAGNFFYKRFANSIKSHIFLYTMLMSCK
jgi:hypothetical protein